MTLEEKANDPRYIGAIEMLGRTGMSEYQIRYDDDPEPVVWIAVATYADGRWEAAAGREPLSATLRLCAQVIDGGMCRHCHKGTAFDENFGDEPLSEIICWYSWDPELKTYRRGCA